MKLFKQLFVVGLSFYLIIGMILILMIHNVILYYNGGTFGRKKQSKIEVVDTVGYKLDDEVTKPKIEPVVIPKEFKKDTQVKEKEVVPIKDTNTVIPTQDSLKS